MFSKNRDKLRELSERQTRGQLLDARLDKMGHNLVRAAQASEEEIEQIATSPFLYTRLRARISAEQEKIVVGEGNIWWAMLLTAWRPFAGMALMATFAAVLFWFTAIAGTTTTSANLALSSNDYLATGNSSFERIVFTDQGAPSNDEVLTTLMNEDESEVQK